jgi:uncharacterized protein (TIGR03437 family)
MRLVRFAISISILTAASQGFAQSLAWDSSGNSMLSGTYYFREAIWALNSSNPDAYALFGTITFSGTGTYTIANATYLDYEQGSQPLSTSGTYSIGAGGFGFLSNPLSGGVAVRGMVSNGVFIASSTEGGFNDLFIAGQLPSPTPTTSSFSGTYAMAYFNFPSQVNQEAYDAQFNLSPSGSGALGTVTMSGVYLGQDTSGNPQTATVSQTASGVKYSVTNGAAVITFPNYNQGAPQNTLLLTGQEYLYFSPDGNFVFGGAPNQVDILVGVRTSGGSAPTMNSPLYYNAGIFNSAATGDFETYYGSFNLSNGGIIEHTRYFSAGVGQSFDSISTGTAPITAGATYSDPYYNYTIGANGNYRIGFGIAAGGPGVDIAVAAPCTDPQACFTGSGVFLNPAGVLNSASYAPFTSGVAPGELLVLKGTGLAPNARIGAGDIATSSTFPNTLNGVQVLIDGIAAPLYYVESTQIAAIVPYAASGFPFATIQVNNNGSLSSIITEFVNPGAPGVFTIPADGVGLAAAEHLDGSLITEKSPAQPGESISVYLTGLGAVFPPLAGDGQPGASPAFNKTVNTINAVIDGPTASTAASVLYSGLAPTLTGLYQVNLTIPSGVTAGDNYLEIDVLNSAGNPTAIAEEALIPIGSGAVSSIRPEEQNSQTYKSTKHRNPQPLKKPIVIKPRTP